MPAKKQNEHKKAQALQRRKEALFDSLESAIAAVAGLSIPIITGLFHRLPNIEEARRFKEAGEKLIRSYRRMEQYLDELLDHLQKSRSDLFTPEDFATLFLRWTFVREHMKANFRNDLMVFFQITSDRDPFFLRQINIILLRKGEPDVQAFLGKLDTIQALMQSLLASPHYQAAQHIVQEKQAYLKNRIALKQTETEVLQAEKEKEIGIREADRIRLNAEMYLEQARKDRLQALQQKQVAVEHARASREQARFEREKVQELEKLPTPVFIEAFSAHLLNMEGEDFQKQYTDELKILFESLEDAIYDTGHVPVTKRHIIPEYTKRVDMQEAMLSAWDEKENRLDRDSRLSKKQKRRRRQRYEDILERDIDALYEEDS